MYINNSIQDSNIKTQSSTSINQSIIQSCGCGCGEIFNAIDSQGRRRLFVLGHNRRGSKGRNKTLQSEIDKIKTLEQAKTLIYQQAIKIAELEAAEAEHYNTLLENLRLKALLEEKQQQTTTTTA